MRIFIIILLFLGCKGEFTDSDILWEKKDSKNKLFDGIKDKSLIKKNVKEFTIQAQRMFEHLKIKKDSMLINKEQKIKTH